MELLGAYTFLFGIANITVNTRVRSARSKVFSFAQRGTGIAAIVLGSILLLRA